MVSIEMRLCGVGLAFFCAVAFSHQGHHHNEEGGKKPNRNVDKVPTTDAMATAYKQISEAYNQNILTVFKAKCFDCHSGETRYPWYHAIPGVRSYIDRDIAEARSHVDFSSGFPFKGHGTPTEDLAAIKHDIGERRMPPLLYRLVHPGSAVTPEEEKTILAWVDESVKALAGLPAQPSDLSRK